MENQPLEHAIKIERKVGDALLKCSKEVIKDLITPRFFIRFSGVTTQIWLILFAIYNLPDLLLATIGDSVSDLIVWLAPFLCVVGILFLLTLPIFIIQWYKKNDRVSLRFVLFQGFFWMPVLLSLSLASFSNATWLETAIGVYISILVLLLTSVLILLAARQLIDNVPVALMLTSSQVAHIDRVQRSKIPSQLEFAKRVINTMDVSEAWTLNDWQQIEQLTAQRETGIDVQVSTVSLLLAVLAFLGLLPTLLVNGLEGLFGTIAGFMSTTVGNIIPIGADTVQNMILVLLIGMTLVGVLFFNGMYKNARIQEIILIICRGQIATLQDQNESVAVSDDSRQQSWLRRVLFR